jgi:hypothetical protein
MTQKILMKWNLNDDDTDMDGILIILMTMMMVTGCQQPHRNQWNRFSMEPISCFLDTDLNGIENYLDNDDDGC